MNMAMYCKCLFTVFFVFIITAYLDGVNCQKYFDVGEDYLCTKWDPYTECSATCAGGRRGKTRRCVWKEPDEEDGEGFTDTITQACNTFKCPQYGKWSSWSKCSVTCGKGLIQRERKCSSFGLQNECTHSTTESKPCTLTACPKWGNWGKWGRCSVTCGEGVETRKRFCDANTVRGPSCEGLNIDHRKCTAVFCPYWGDWSEWSSCDASCGPGTRVKSRTCVRDPNTPAKCDGDARTVEACTRQPCSIWSAWSDWGTCDVTCGDGKQSRGRKCTHLDGGKGKCEGKSNELKSCDIPVCPSWDEWTVWSECSAECGGGVQDRHRKCVAEPGLICTGDSVEDQPCALYVCPQWDSWSSWSACLGYCGPGIQKKTRECQEDSSIKLKCQGSNITTRSCQHPECSSWNGWNMWTECDATCDGGTKERQRYCSRKNNFDCEGEAMQTVVCAPHKCPRWEQWSDWATCNASCDGGSTDRSRGCIVDPQSDFNCSGNGTQSKQCGQTPCNECTIDLLNCGFNPDFCNFSVSSLSPLGFFFRTDPKGFAETYAPFPNIGDWTELRSVVLKGCMAGSYCLAMDYTSGSVGSETSRAFVLLRTGENDKDEIVWDVNDREKTQGKIATFDVQLIAGTQIVVQVHKDTKSFEYFWIHSITATKGQCS